MKEKTKVEKEELLEAYEKAYAWRAESSDIEWKDLGFGKPLAYLSWAVAWREMKRHYPDANYRLVETPEGSPLWNINGYGMLKCAVSALGVEHIETFPVMDNRNNAMTIESIDGRDVNDSAQRGLTKAIARFGIGAYIFEGKLKPSKTVSAKAESQPQVYRNPTASAPQGASPQQVAFLKKLLEGANKTLAQFKEENGYDPIASRENASKAIAQLKILQ